MYYVNWGRYTQLAGQVILPVLMWLTWRVAEKTDWDWRLTILAVVAFAGLGVTHYRVVLIYGVFVVAVALLLLVRRWGQWRRIGGAVLRLIVVSGVVVALFLPWGTRTLSTRMAKFGMSLVQRNSPREYQRGEYNAIGDVSFFVPWGLLVLAIGAMVWLILRRQFAGWFMVLWVSGLLLLANPHRLGLTGTGIVNNFTVFIMFYIPVGGLVGEFIAAASDRMWRWRRWTGVALWILAIAYGSGWGMIQRTRDLSSAHVLVTEADMGAMAWIRENTPQDARFLVNGFTAYGGKPVVGADAGWWIPLLTGRGNTVPPINYGLETAFDPEYTSRVRGDLLYLQRVSLIAPEAMQFLEENDITHIYVGQGNGMIGNPGTPLLDAHLLSQSSMYRLLYNQDGVRIFGVIRG
jgi:hypothetical protein